jgi:hypothetical protein
MIYFYILLFHTYIDKKENKNFWSRYQKTSKIRLKIGKFKEFR